MLTGEALWDSKTCRGLVTKEVEGVPLRVYADAPASLYGSLAGTARRQPDDVALVADDGTRVTFATLRSLVDQAAASLARVVRPGQRVALLLDTSIEFAVAVYAVNKCAAVVVPVPSKHRESEIEALLRRSEPSLLIVERRFESLALIEAAPLVWFAEDRAEGYGFRRWPLADLPVSGPEPDEGADCILMYTSGTTSRSKGVCLTNRNVGHAIVAYQRIFELDSNDSSIIPVPIYHITGMVALLGLFVHVGGTLYLHRRFNAKRVLETVRDEGITMIHASPTVFALLLAERGEFPSLPTLRIMACGAAHMPVGRIQALHEWLPTMSVRTIYGLTETSSPGVVFPCDAATSVHRGASGRPIPGLDVMVRTEDGSDASVGERGEVWVRGTNVLRCYDPPTEELEHDGWLNTHDVGYVNEDGYLFIVDRTKDMINRGGEKVWTIDVEEALRQVSGVVDAAVVGIPSEIYGEEVAAFVETEDGCPVPKAVIDAQLERLLAHYENPTRFVFGAHLPLTTNMKIDKAEVRRRFAEQPSHEEAGASAGSSR